MTSICAPHNNDYPDSVLVNKWNSIIGIHDESIRCFDGNQTRFNVEITMVAGKKNDVFKIKNKVM